jgi:hypothetical protein
VSKKWFDRGCQPHHLWPTDLQREVNEIKQAPTGSVPARAYQFAQGRAAAVLCTAMVEELIVGLRWFAQVLGNDVAVTVGGASVGVPAARHPSPPWGGSRADPLC